MPFSEAELKALEATAMNPKGRRIMAQAVKTVIPEYQLPPDIEAEDRVNAMVDEKIKTVMEDNKALREQIAKDKADKSWQEEVAKVRKELGWGEKQLTEFLKDFSERYKDAAPVSLATLAKAYEHENAPLMPSQPTQGVGRFWGPMGDTEKEWRTAVKDPNSDFMKAVRSGNQRKKKEIKKKWWDKAGQEWQELSNR